MCTNDLRIYKKMSSAVHAKLYLPAQQGHKDAIKLSLCYWVATRM